MIWGWPGREKELADLEVEAKKISEVEAFINQQKGDKNIGE